jgi:predicted nucleotidyltransferase
MSELNEFGLSDKTMKLIYRVFSGFPEIEEVIIFGSRADCTFRNGSDIDLAIKGSNLDRELTIVIKNLLQEGLFLPYFFDVINYNSLPEGKFKSHIDNFGKLFYRK